eukprot:CAMPEP_0116895306 /NCGR_PEP_ID=MMETSP0467-20121206/4859_1 /TAXON_ID=283647 /ORGANISM="Mesodinium pulex, Strain SPMC105" /LENGTH=77 /DNA_ID=CAMNT_0004565963 /DNA_START=714 /DNA_END=947 /DNA_ORIENTATION=-
MVCGYPPFYGNCEEEIVDKVKNSEVCFDGDEWNVVDNKVKDLIRMILDKDPAKRLKSSEILGHDWLVLNQEKNKLKN